MRARGLPLLLLAGCVGEFRVGTDWFAVWSEDGEAVGLVARDYQTRPGFFWEERSYLGAALFVEDPDSRRRAPVVELTQDRSPPDQALYFLRREGYLWVRSWEPPGPLFRRVALDGEVLDLPRACVGDPSCEEDVVPAPNGAWLLRAVRTEAALTVELLDARSFARVGAPTRFERTGPTTVAVAFGDAAPALHRVAASWFPRWTWTPSGEVLVVLPALTVCEAPGCVERPCTLAWRTAPDAPPVEIDPPGCTEPRTASGPIGPAGRVVTAKETGVLSFAEGDPAMAFGCQRTPSLEPRCPETALP